jgi:hypothetical protein
VIHTTCGTIFNVDDAAVTLLTDSSQLNKLAALINEIECNKTQADIYQGVYVGGKSMETNKRNRFKSDFGSAGNHLTKKAVENGVTWRCYIPS